MYLSYSYLSFHEALNERLSASFGNTGNLGREIGSALFKGADDEGSELYRQLKK
jgi:hypothetical protein